MPKVERSCARCAVTFAVWPSVVSRGGGTFCSNACASGSASTPSRRTATPRTCEQCGTTFMVVPFRLKQGRGLYCSRSCNDVAKTRRVARTCEYCSGVFAVPPWKVAAGVGRFCSRSCAGRYRPPRTVTPRDGDARQARQRVRRQILNGERPEANSVPCTDCGHIWSHGQRRHEYDHYVSYDADDHLEVEAVCTRCHKARGRARLALYWYLQGWIDRSGGKIAASWERWVNRSEDDELVDAF